MLAGDTAHPTAVASKRTALAPRQLSDDELDLFARVGTTRKMTKGEIIFRRGELGRSMFIVESGQVRLEFGDGLPDKSLGAREFFGELAMFIGSHSRVANAVVLVPGTMHIIDHAAFEAIVASQPRLLAQFMRRSFSYLVTSEQQLIQSLKRRNEDLMVTLDSLRHTRAQLCTAQRLVQTDELTGLCNRRGLYMFLERLPDCRVPGTVLGMLLVDVDRFKQINDHSGHLVGDQVLRAIAEEVQGVCASIDLPARLGGDEFAAIMHVTDEQELRARATQIIAAVRALCLPACSDRVSVSIGGSLCEEGADWAIWYSDTDAALYEAKGRGGDGYHVVSARDV